MGLFDDMPESRPRRQRCTVALLADDLPAEDRPAFERVMGNPRIYASDIATKLREGGHYISDQTLNRHRKGKCSCEQRV